MKPQISLACAVLIGAASLSAQITAVLNRPPGRSPEIEIRNNSTADLTAFAISMRPAARNANGTPFLFFADTASDTDRQITDSVPLPTRLLPGQPRQELFEPPIVTAAIFADGTTAGNAALLERLILRRCNMLQAVELTRDILSDAGRHNVPRNQLIEEFRKLADSLDHWYLPAEQQAGRPLYQSIVEKLLNVPELPLGAPFPPTSLVEQETAALNRQRTILLESQPGLRPAEPIPVRQ